MEPFVINLALVEGGEPSWRMFLLVAAVSFVAMGLLYPLLAGAASAYRDRRRVVPCRAMGRPAVVVERLDGQGCSSGVVSCSLRTLPEFRRCGGDCLVTRPE